jgi:hypothetical protein
MKSAFSSLMQSKFFTPSFNSAIFDGPLRIYFSQVHESFALKVYFIVQEKLALELNQIKEYSRKTGRNLMIMIYPTVENFKYSFEGHRNVSDLDLLAMDQFEDDIVIGVRSPLEDHEIEYIVDQSRVALRIWKNNSSTIHINNELQN